MTSAKNVANAVGGKTSRACDSCIRKRARWYCAADDAFLCQACDSSVHSANPLARRHERVPLKAASYKSSSDASWAPSWHRGITKKARTPRHRNPFHLVPEVGSDETNSNSHYENEEQLLYRVPIFDPFVAELCSTPSSVTSANSAAMAGANGAELKYPQGKENGVSVGNNNNGMENLHGFSPSDMELAEFAADVENLLGKGLENECICMEELGLIDSKEESRECSVGSGKQVKVENEEGMEVVGAATACKLETEQMDFMGREQFELSFDYESPTSREEAEEKVAVDVKNGGEIKPNNEGKRKILLRLDYEAVIAGWATQKSPWTNGDKPDLDADDVCWPDCMGGCGTEVCHPYGELKGYGCKPAMANAGREARVSRYREKRRTRLFSKKIRYEVRKLNAEKRPRMKGRFVKRASFAAPTFPLLRK